MTDITATSGPAGNGESAPILSAPAPGTTPPPAAPAENWFSGFDQDTLGWMENRGLTKMDQKAALENTITGFRNAEKFIGVPHDKLLRLPDWDKADKSELDQFFSKLGRPADPKQYELPVPEGVPTDFADWAKNTFHELGLTGKQATNLAAKWNEYNQNLAAGMKDNYNQNVAVEEAALKREWGAAFEQEMGVARNAAKKLGLDEGMLDAMERQLGFGGLIKKMNEIGRKLGEDSFVSGERSGGPLTPAQAKAKIAQLQNDKDFVQKYLAGNIDARSEMERLHMFVAGNHG